MAQAAAMSGKVALITGGNAGIGRATAHVFAKRGAAVVFSGRRAEEGKKVEGELKGLGAKALFVQGDASKESDIKALVDQTLKSFGRLDYAFNNAGVEGQLGPTVEHTEANYRHVFDINVLGVMLSMKHQIPAMMKTGGGAIVNNASIAGRIGMAGVGVYVASKHAVLGLTKCAAMEVAKSGIRVNAVSPGAIETAMFQRFAGTDDSKAYMTSLHPIGRLGKDTEIAEAVVWLCSDGASFVTGHDLLVDGGFCVP